MFPVPDQFAILVNFLDPVEGHFVNDAVGFRDMKEKVVVFSKVYII